MEWKLERAARRRVRTEEEMLWEKIMRVLAKDMKEKSQSFPKLRVALPSVASRNLLPTEVEMVPPCG